MHRQNQAINSTNDCAHERSIIDIKEGTRVCPDCCLVVNNVIYGNFDFIPRQTGESSIRMQYRTEAEQKLSEVIAKQHLPEGLIDTTKMLYNTLKTDKVNTLYKYKCDELMAFSLYINLVKAHCPLSPNFIASYFNVNPKILFQIEKESNILVPPLDLEDVIDRFCTVVDLDYFQKREIRSIVLHLFGYNNQPQTLATGIIYLYCYHKNITTSRYNKGNLKQICELCLVSHINVHRLLKKDNCLFSKQVHKVMQNLNLVK